ncbi:MAG: metalloregulator ArsR/SmtB family transcription factor [Anaerolineae bacterium]|jgi:ArsR family transcriptional regulator|nr:metalloregulator ArsR/SmtB family transcription factor [Anaerolineae bacterium]
MDLKTREEVALLHSRFCASLADPTRMLIIYELSDASRNVGELATRLNIAQPVISRHLKILRDSGIVVSERDGRAVYYRLSDERVVQALNLLRSMIADQVNALAKIV